MGNPKAYKTVIIAGSYTPLDITGESITIPTGIAGTVKNFYFGKHPIADSNKSYMGGSGDTSIALTSTTFDNEVSYGTDDEDMSNGDYWVDYITGKSRGKKKDTGTSMTADYSIFTS